MWTCIGVGVGAIGVGTYWHEFKNNKEIAENIKNATKQNKKVQGQFNVLLMGIIFCSSLLTGLFTDYFVNKAKRKRCR